MSKITGKSRSSRGIPAGQLLPAPCYCTQL